jgi:exopolysaccharide biosynthesis polyprenyl glycosylphosphotransferase
MSFVPDQLGRLEPAGITLPVPLVIRRAAAVPAAAGQDEKIPRLFLILFDVAALALAFAATRIVAPWVQWLLIPSGPLGLSLPAWLSLPESFNPAEFPTLSSVAWVLVITIPITLLSADLLGGYRPVVDQSRTRVVLSSVLSPLMALSGVTLALFALKISSSSRVVIFTFGGMSVLGLLGYRSALRMYQMRRLAAGLYAKNVVLVGQPSAVKWMTDHFRQNVPTNRFRLAGWLSVQTPAEAMPSPTVARREGDDGDLPCLGAAEELGRILISRPLHEVIAVQSAGDRDWLRQVIEECDYFRVRLRIVPEALLVGTLRDLKLVFRTEPLRLPEVELAPPHLETDALFLKRLIDIAFSATLLVVLSPLFLLIAIAIKLTTPHLALFYPWRVVGYQGRHFTGYKFTTMTADADERKKDLMDRNEMSGPVFKIMNDPRLTRLGRFLRKYSLNELPQLWSVLKGDMSLVGPRPAGPHELERYQLWHKRKLCVQPGITCIWQVSGRNLITDFDEWVRLDLEYIDRWSLWLDFRILMKTARTVVAGTGS